MKSISLPWFCLALLLSACTGGTPGDAHNGSAPGNVQDDSTGDELPLGDRAGDDKADGQWGAALTCKAIPELPQLVAPRITISLNGLTLHLVDEVSGYDKVFPIGPGQIEDDETATSYGESLSYYPVLATGRQDFEISPRTVNACRTWWTDPDSQERSPVFGGLPFMSFYGPYAIHGPIDNYRAPNGGSLRRGYVSHGCIRMEAADVAELYGRIKTLARVPVRLQREAERLASGVRVDVSARFVGAECATDADCNYAGGFCHPNAYGGRGFCSAHCERTCADRAGSPTTFCVADPDSSTQEGMCVPKTVAQNPDCRAYGQMVAQLQPRRGQPSLQASVCVPGSRGSIGDPCRQESECRNGATCAGASDLQPGACSLACESICPDEPGYPMTACAEDPVPGSGLARGCVRSCTPASNASECEGGSTCVARSPSNPKDRRYICRPAQ